MTLPDTPTRSPILSRASSNFPVILPEGCRSVRVPCRLVVTPSLRTCPSWKCFHHGRSASALTIAASSLRLARDPSTLVGPYDTFEDYCKDVEGLAYSTAQYKIKSYLVHSAIEENLGPAKVGPSIESQVRQLFDHENAIAKFKTEKRMVEKQKEPSMSFSP
jgi:hypothetical protein